MKFVTSVKTCFSKYATFSGRASRSEFWWFYLAVFIASCIPVVGVIVSIATIVPMLAVGARRLHDAGHSGWKQLWLYLPNIILIGWVLIMFLLGSTVRGIPMWTFLGTVGFFVTLGAWIFLLFCWTEDSEPGDNEYGANPKA